MRAEEAFDQYHIAVFRYLYRMTRRPEVAEELAQECFVELLRHAGRFDERRGTMKNYLFSIARNLALHHLRDERDWEELDEEQEPPGLTVRHGMDPGVSFAVGLAVAGLPALQREALVLFQYEGFSLEEIATLGGVEVGTVKSRLFRAREALKKSLAPYQGRCIDERR